MTKNEAIKVISDHMDLGTPIRVVEESKDNYKVFAECTDGTVEIKVK